MGIPIISIQIFRSLHWGPFILGKYHTGPLKGIQGYVESGKQVVWKTQRKLVCCVSVRVKGCVRFMEGPQQ